MIAPRIAGVLAAAVLSAQPPAAPLRIDPPVITRCVNGSGRATLEWSVPTSGGVRIRVGAPNGPAMTGLEPESGSTQTGDWVTDRMLFFLVDQSGGALAQVTARVGCLTDGESAALRASSYFPLNVGNYWVYRTNNRTITSTYVTWRVMRLEEREGVVWHVVSIERPNATAEVLLREDGEGRVFRIGGPGARPGEAELWLDVSPSADAAALLRAVSREPLFAGEIGVFPDAVRYNTSRLQSALVDEEGVVVRGIGIVQDQTNMVSGSSGGLLERLDLVEAKLGEHLRISPPATTIHLTLEAARLDVSGKKAMNCAVPCYFVACGFAPGTDPPGTYKPCMQSRIRVQVPGQFAPARLTLELLDASGRALITRELAPPAVSGETVTFNQLPLYTTGNAPLTPGAYRVRAVLESAPGAPAASAEARIVIE